MVYREPVANTDMAEFGFIVSASFHQRYCGTGQPGGDAEHVKVTPVPSVATGFSGVIDLCKNLVIDFLFNF